MYPKPLPLSLLSTRNGQSIDFFVIEIGLKSVVVSRKRAVQIQTWKQIRRSLSNGTIISGKVKEIQPYGAFIDLGGVDGFLHISKIKDIWINNIRSFLKKDQLIKVIVSDIDEDKKRISLLLCQLEIRAT